MMATGHVAISVAHPKDEPDRWVGIADVQQFVGDAIERAEYVTELSYTDMDDAIEAVKAGIDSLLGEQDWPDVAEGV